jgi:ABC-2 type transport system permease protein
MKWPAQVAAQTRKELTQFRRDGLGMALAFVLPLVALLIYGYAIRLEAKNIPLAIVDEDDTAFSRALIERFYASEIFRAVPVGARKPLDLIESSDAKAVVILAPGTSRRVAAGKSAQFQVLVDGADVVNASVVRGAIVGAVATFSASLAPVVVPVTSVVRLWFNPGRDEALYIVPGVYAIVLSLFPAMLAAIALVRDREEGTIVQVFASGVGAVPYVAGKWLAYLAVGAAEAVVVVGMGSLLWHVGFVTSPVAWLLTTALFLGAVIAMGLALGARSATQSAAVQSVGTVMNLPSMLLTGFLYPLTAVPFALAAIGYLVPAKYAIDANRDAFVRGGGWLATWYDPLVLLLITAVALTATWRTLRRMQLEG